MHIINHLCTYGHQTELSVFSPKSLSNCADLFNMISRFWNRWRPNNCFATTSYTKIRWNNAK